MIEPTTTFLARRRWREESRELTQQLALGYGAGFILLALGAYKYFMGIGAADGLWAAAMVAGLLCILATLVAPALIKGPEAGLRRFGNLVGHALMNIVLATIYLAVIWPVGAALRARKGADPIYEWDRTPPAGMEGWHAKRLPHDLQGQPGASAGTVRRVGMVGVLSFFARRGQLIFVPVLLVLVSLGIVLFFIQTSALAPFIYTLF